jgi:hypothetical protein
VPTSTSTSPVAGSYDFTSFCIAQIAIPRSERLHQLWMMGVKLSRLLNDSGILLLGPIGNFLDSTKLDSPRARPLGKETANKKGRQALL